MALAVSDVTADTPLIDLSRVMSPRQASSNETPLTEWKNSREITTNFEDGMIVHVYDVPGNPAEARLDSRLGQMPVGSIHPWAGLKEHSGAYDHHFLQRQSYKHLVRSSVQAERLTRVTNVYRQTPCPNMYSLEIRSALRSVQEWHAKERPENHPEPWNGTLSGSQTPVAIPQVRPVVVKRYRKVEMPIVGGGSVLELAKKVGRTNGEKFMESKDVRMWLFEGLHARMIYGTPAGDESGRYIKGWFELTLFFEADVERRHEWWRPLVGAEKSTRPNVPILWEQGVLRENLHIRKVIYPVLKEDFHNLVPVNEDPCIPPAPEGIP